MSAIPPSTPGVASALAVALPPDALSGVALECGAVLTLEDGTRLVSDIYRPAGDGAGAGPWPVLLMRQPYGRDIASTVVYAHPSWFARRGFMVVVQDVRGRGDSDGDFYCFRHEIDDGRQTVRWAASLPGANGRVGMYGFSYQGSTQLLAALGRPPELRALAPHMTAFDLYSGWFYRGGLLQLSTTLSWASQMLREDSRRRACASEAELDANFQNTGRLTGLLPTRDIRPLVNSDLPSYGADWLRNPTPDGYWREFDLLARVAELGLPMFHLSGWYDLYLRGSVDGYRAMSAAHPNQFLLATPWVHLPWGNLTGGADLGPAAVPAVDEMMAEWFHHWLDRDTPPSAAPAGLTGCRYFVLGENAWRHAATWPPPEAVAQTWYLSSAGRANSRFGDGKFGPGEAFGPDDLFNYDPEVPVAAPGGNQGGHAGFGAHDLAAQQQGINLLVYDTPPFAQAAVLAGDPACVLHVTSSAPETSFVVRLSRVTREGRAIFLTLGAAQTRAQAGAEVRIALDPTATRIEAGERLRLDVASSAFPLLIRHPNTEADPASVARAAEFRRALQVVHHDSARPSRAELPFLSTPSFAA
ncbi:MAG: CocE/NonD family hydrolase [Burkholderiales bacterium]|nr:CocE/NonD family hydrolase [Opitutaceae bacterium]